MCRPRIASPHAQQASVRVEVLGMVDHSLARITLTAAMAAGADHNSSQQSSSLPLPPPRPFGACSNTTMAKPSSRNESLVIAASVMTFERCYIREWVEYHVALGASTIYLMPIWNTSIANTAFDEEIRHLSLIEQPRVRVICNVGGEPSNCNETTAVPYNGRIQQSWLLLNRLVPQHWTAGSCSLTSTNSLSCPSLGH